MRTPPPARSHAPRGPRHATVLIDVDDLLYRRDTLALADLVRSLSGFLHRTAGARLQGGMWFDMGGFSLSPRAALAWINADVDGFYEQGPAAQYNYADRSVQATTAEIAHTLAR